MLGILLLTRAHSSRSETDERCDRDSQESGYGPKRPSATGPPRLGRRSGSLVHQGPANPPFAARALGVLGPKFTTSYIVVQGACDHELYCDYGQCLTVTGFGRG